MTDWQQGYADAYCKPLLRGFPAMPHNEDYMDGFMAGQSAWKHNRRAKDMGHFKLVRCAS